MTIVLHSSFSLSFLKGLPGILTPPPRWTVPPSAIHKGSLLRKEPAEGMLDKTLSLRQNQIFLARHWTLASNLLWSIYQRGWTLLFPAVLPRTFSVSAKPDGNLCLVVLCEREILDLLPDGFSLLRFLPEARHHRTPDVQLAARIFLLWAQVLSFKGKVSVGQ